MRSKRGCPLWLADQKGLSLLVRREVLVRVYVHVLGELALLHRDIRDCLVTLQLVPALHGLASSPRLVLVIHVDLGDLPATVGFGCLYFFGASQKKGE